MTDRDVVGGVPAELVTLPALIGVVVGAAAGAPAVTSTLDASLPAEAA